MNVACGIYNQIMACFEHRGYHLPAVNNLHYSIVLSLTIMSYHYTTSTGEPYKQYVHAEWYADLKAGCKMSLF